MADWSRPLCAALLFAALLFAGVATARAQAPERCAALAQFGAYDTRPALPDAVRAEAFRTWACQASIAHESDLRVAGAALGIAPELLEGTLGFDPGGAQDFLGWKHAFCASARSDRRLADKLADFVKGLQPTVTAALATCEAPPGLHVRLEQTASACEFIVHLDWTMAAGNTAPQDVQVSTTDPHVTCEPTPLQTPFAVTGPTDLHCTRHDDNAIALTVAAPSAHVSGFGRLKELSRVLPDPQTLLGGEYDVEIQWRERSGRGGAPTSDVWHLDLSTGTCRITDRATGSTPHSAWFTHAKATCSPLQIAFAGYRSAEAMAKDQPQYTLLLRSEDNGATFTGSGTDTAGNIAVQATARHRGPMPPPDQVVCKP